MENVPVLNKFPARFASGRYRGMKHRSRKRKITSCISVVLIATENGEPREMFPDLAQRYRYSNVTPRNNR